MITLLKQVYKVVDKPTFAKHFLNTYYGATYKQQLELTRQLLTSWKSEELLEHVLVPLYLFSLGTGGSPVRDNSKSLAYQVYVELGITIDETEDDWTGPAYARCLTLAKELAQ